MTAAPRRAPALLAVLAALALAAGCAKPWSIDGPEVSVVESGTDGRGDAASDLPALAGGDSCEAEHMGEQPPTEFTVLPAHAVLVSVVHCRFETQLVRGDGEWWVRIKEEATAGLDSLATALRLPSEVAISGATSAMIGYLPIILTVRDTTGRQLHPAVPHGVCGGPLPAATAAIAGLSWRQIESVRISQSRSELEVGSGCSGSWKPMIALVAAEGSGSQVATVDPTGRPLTICRYQPDLNPANAITVNSGSSFRIGVLTNASTMDVAAAAQLLTAIATAPRVLGPCATPEAPFAIVHPTDGGGPRFAIETAGCHRVLVDGENSLRQLDAATVARLVA